MPMFLNFLAITTSSQARKNVYTHTHSLSLKCKLSDLHLFTSLTGEDQCSKASTHAHTHESLMDKKKEKKENKHSMLQQ